MPSFNLSQWIVIATIFVASLVYFQCRYGVRAMAPTNVDWIMAKGSDWTPDYLAWKYYRYQPWSFPLGIMEGYSYPQKVSIGLTGAIPLLAVPIKIFSKTLPDDFQYHGFWLFLCSFFQGLLAFYLIKACGVKENLYALIGALIFTFSYSMMDRLGHLNLCAHWTVLAGLLVYFSDYSFKRTILYHALIIFATIWIHPYLVIFSVGLTAITFFQRWFSKKINIQEFFIAGMSTGMVALFSWWLIGNFVLGGDNSGAGGFGEFSTNLSTFWNPKFDTFIINHQPFYFDGQYEGIAYLGIGVLLVLLLVLTLTFTGKIKFRQLRNHWILILFAIVLFVFSLSQFITYNDHLLFTIPYSNSIIEQFSTLRASGRYVWLLQYLIILLAIIGVYKSKFSIKVKTGILGLALLLNIVDFNYYFQRNPIFNNKIEPITDFKKETWEKVIATGNSVVMYPPHVRTYNTSYDETPFISIAAKQKKPINTGHLARVDNKLRSEHKAFIDNALTQNLDFFRDKAIITTKLYAEKFQNLVGSNKVDVFSINDFLAYVPIAEKEIIDELKIGALRDSMKFTRESFESFWNRNKEQTIIVAARDEASNHLSNCTILNQTFKNLGSQISEIGYRASYAGIFINGALVKEKVGIGEEKINFSALIDGNNISVISAGMNAGNIASIKVNDKELAVNDRGLNMVVVDKNGQLIESTFFDTYRQCFHNSEFVERTFPIWKIVDSPVQKSQRQDYQ